MIRTLRAFVWLRWRLLRNSLGVGRHQRRDALEQLSRALALVVPLVVVALSLGSVAGMAIAGYFGGLVAARGTMDSRAVVLIIRGVLLAACGLLIAFATLSPSQSTFARYTRLLLLPISRRTLHLVEVLAALSDPWLMALAPGVVMVAVGLASGGRPGVAGAALVAGLTLLLVIASLAALVSFLVGWLLKDRRRSEMFTLVFVLGLALVSVLPALFSARAHQRRENSDGRPETTTTTRTTPEPERRGMAAEELDARLPIWTRALPSELYGHAVDAAFARRPGGVAAAIGTLAIEGVVVFLLSGVVHRKIVEAVDGHRGVRGRARAATAGPRLPLLSPAASAVAGAQLRTALRSIRGRLIVLMPGPMLSLMAFVSSSMPNGHFGSAMAGRGYALLGVGGLAALYTMHAFTMNLFGTDRAGLSLQFLAPISDADLARGKIAGCAMIFTVSLALCLAGALVVAPGGSPWLWAAAAIGGYATLVWMSPIAIWLSAFFPVAADMTKTGTGGNPHALSMLGGTIALVALAAPSVLSIAAAAILFQRPATAVALTTAWLALGLLVAMPLLTIASRAIGLRRENLAIVAQGR